ncbi:YcgN family cysteine cluster protein [uncultured Shewanella sp.]|uniref:YcgN family cysteine cluster protein n=1 Tax=uncultured Shewanella sp. TaxID=173975 RepID=UPI002624DBF4|nr:YcgN family cysteine cluster protein [uncultured Shewanella sp.]
MAFWKTIPLVEMSQSQWESLCDGCGKCCLNKIIDDETETLYYTNVACELLEHQQGGCQDYAHRFSKVPSCTKVSMDNIAELTWLPNSCAYRRLYLGRELPSWHPLITGSKDAMQQAGIGINGRVIDEKQVEYLDDHIVLWPLKDVD